MGDLAAGERIERWATSLRVGVTGHRLVRLADASLPELARGVDGVLARIAAALPGAHALHLVTSLADGADSIAADAALSRGWRLDVILPMPAGQYEEDFAAGDPRDGLRARIAAANARLELPSAEEGDDGRTAAYERAGRLMLAQSDLVIAVWDGRPARGRGGAAQIIAEAVLRGIPVIHVDPAAPGSPVLLWDGLSEHDSGQQRVETVARGGLDRLPELTAMLTAIDPDALGGTLLAEMERPSRRPRHSFAVAYPLLLAAMGIRRLRRADFGSPPEPAPDEAKAPAGETSRDAAVRRRLALWFARADASAVVAGQTFRSAYVTNYALATLAVAISLSGLAMPRAVQPVLPLLELATTAAILGLTSLGRRGSWHRRWLDQRHLAERLRCFLTAHRLGELGLRRGRAAEGNWVTWSMHAAARMAGLPCVAIDDAYLASVRDELLDLLDDQIGYLATDAARMHKLEHRLHRLGSLLFTVTALICLVSVLIQLGRAATGLPAGEPGLQAFSIASTIIGAVLPACGAAIYGLRMQGDFAGIAERDATLAARLSALRTRTAEGPLQFDLLWHRMRRATDLLTDDLSTWLHTYRARPLSLPG